ncbi:MAG: class I adenylate-forming enzyme family protein [Actinomycetota bacterium]
MNLAFLGEQNLDKFGEYTQLIFQDRQFTNAELLSTASRFARALSDAGVKPGDRVGVMLPNLPEVGISYSAILRTGAIAIPMIFLLAVPEIAHILADSEAGFVITSPEFQPNVAKACEELASPPKVIVVGDDIADGCLSWSSMIERAATPLPIVDRDDEDLAVVMYTSGTTGHPKGVMLSHGNLMFNSVSSAQAVDLREGDVTVGGLPMAHLFGMAGTVTASLFKITGVLLPWFTAEGFFDAVSRYGASSSAAVPTMLAYMLSHPGFDEVDWSKFRWIIVAAAPVPVELAEEFEKRTGARVLEAYGMTETSPTVSIMRADEPSRLGSCGKPVPNIKVAILDDDDKHVPEGEPGELCVQGPNVMKGYYKLPEKTAEVMRNGWLHTGDVARMDGDGYIYITERKKDLIIRGGFNIFPRDVEDILYSHPAVLEAAVVGMPDEKLGEEVVAYVVLRPGEHATEDELMQLCKEALAKFKTPKHLRFVSDLPKNPIGKILKRDLREMAKIDFA